MVRRSSTRRFSKAIRTDTAQIDEKDLLLLPSIGALEVVPLDYYEPMLVECRQVTDERIRERGVDMILPGAARVLLRPHVERVDDAATWIGIRPQRLLERRVQRLADDAQRHALETATRGTVAGIGVRQEWILWRPDAADEMSRKRPAIEETENWVLQKLSLPNAETNRTTAGLVMASPHVRLSR